MADDGTVVGRAIAILDAVSDMPAPVSLAVLTQRTGIPKPTVRRIANDMVDRGLLAHSAAGYRSGVKLMSHGLRSVRQHGWDVATQPYLQELNRRSRGGIAWYAKFDNDDILMISTAFSRSDGGEMHPARWPISNGVDAQSVLTVPGRLLFASRPDLVETLWSAARPKLTRYSVVDRPGLSRLLVDARESGFVAENEQVRLGWSCAGALVRDCGGGVVGALGVTIRTNGIRLSPLRTALQRFAESIAHEPSLEFGL